MDGVTRAVARVRGGEKDTQGIRPVLLDCCRAKIVDEGEEELPVAAIDVIDAVDAIDLESRI